MKLLSITLTDIRRFTTPVRIEGIGPGLNLLSAPNETGKSTLFDALQALFFQPHRSKSREIMALRPHAGGGPTVAVEIDLEGIPHRIEKRWLSRPSATVHRGSLLVAQADEAEAFLARLVASEGDGGPAGLLWVRQGLVRLEAETDSPRDRETAKQARRNLMTSVTGEVETLTGGRRMDRALARTRADLALYLTSTGRPAKDGPLARAEIELAELTARHALLQATADRLDQALARRRDVLRALAQLGDPEAQATRLARLTDATQRLDTARRHAESLTAAAATLQSARLAQTTFAERLAALHRARAERDRAAAELEQAQRRAALARSAAATADAALAPLHAALATAQDTATRAESIRAEAFRAEAARTAAARRKELTDRLTQSRSLTERRAPLARAATEGPEAKDITTLSQLAQEAEVQRALHDRSAPHVRFHHSGPARALQDGSPVPDAALPIHAETRFDLPGFGHVLVTPGASTDSGALQRAEAALANALSLLGQPDLAAARQAAAARAEAAEALRDLDRTLRALAPAGLTALEADLAALPPDMPPRPDLPTAAEAEAAATAATEALSRARAAHDAARIDSDRMREADLRASLAAEAAAATRATAESALAPLAAAEPSLANDLATATARLSEAQAIHDTLAADAPDLAAAEAALTRARSVMDSAAADLQRLEVERAGLDRDIAHHSGEGVMEELADTATRLSAAQTAVSRIRFEVEVLQTLATELETARNEARDRYFEPVLAELRPLLRVLWPDAELRFDGESLLPDALIRNGQVEDLSILSGGTQEQIALLVRLAFARLLAKRGQHAPVILDDALVYTDDDRIERMFDALHQQAQDQQILVLSCRQRAFRDLGGTTLTLRPAD